MLFPSCFDMSRYTIFVIMCALCLLLCYHSIMMNYGTSEQLMRWKRWKNSKKIEGNVC